MRLIDADALKERTSEMIVPDWVRTLVRTLIDDNATIDAVPVVHGEWDTHWETAEVCVMHRCSNCHKNAFEKHNYCPNCGAKMDLHELARTYTRASGKDGEE